MDITEGELITVISDVAFCCNFKFCVHHEHTFVFMIIYRFVYVLLIHLFVYRLFVAYVNFPRKIISHFYFCFPCVFVSVCVCMCVRVFLPIFFSQESLTHSVCKWSASYHFNIS